MLLSMNFQLPTLYFHLFFLVYIPIHIYDEVTSCKMLIFICDFFASNWHSWLWVCELIQICHYHTVYATITVWGEITPTVVYHTHLHLKGSHLSRGGEKAPTQYQLHAQVSKDEPVVFELKALWQWFCPFVISNYCTLNLLLLCCHFVTAMFCWHDFSAIQRLIVLFCCSVFSINTVYYMAPFAMMIMGIPALLLEGNGILEWLSIHPYPWTALFIISSSGVLAFCLNFSIFYVIHSTTAVTFNVAGNLKVRDLSDRFNSTILFGLHILSHLIVVINRFAPCIIWETVHIFN